MPFATRNAVSAWQPVRARLALEARVDQVPAARAFVRETLGSRHPCADTAILLTSELVANSVRHSDCGRLGQPVLVSVTLRGTGLRIEVSDRTGPTVPVPRSEDDAIDGHGGMAEGGRGLVLVEALAADWGYERSGTQTTTWFTCLPLPAYGSSVIMTARVPGSRASKTCGTSPGYRR